MSIVTMPSKKSMRNKIAMRSDEIIEVLFDLLHSKNPNTQVAAAKTLINKILPDLKQQEIVGDADKPLGVVILPPTYEATNNMASSSGTAVGSTQAK